MALRSGVLLPHYVRVALPVPIHDCFDYRCPDGMPVPAVGARVRVPIGRRENVGVVLGQSTSSALPAERIKPLKETLDEHPLLDAVSLKLLHWAADYYLEPIGQALYATLPLRLRQGRHAQPEGPARYRAAEPIDEATLTALQRAPRQRDLLARIQAAPDGFSPNTTDKGESIRAALKALMDKGLVIRDSGPCLSTPAREPDIRPELHAEQRAAVETLSLALGGFAAFVLAGVTGSGKTEVYLSIVERVIASGRQALVLAPEIALTPQFVARFRSRFGVPVAVLHSGLGDGERHCAWWSAAQIQAPILIGTRSAVFTPMPRLGVVIVDEEHDLSYKQQEGFRYHARDVAVYRARLQNVPVILGSATPSLESLHNVARSRYQLLRLTHRAGIARPPTTQIIDLRATPAQQALSEPLLAAMREELDSGGQVLLFINRRGYAPVLVCLACNWEAMCKHCDARMTLHAARGELRCHHCDSRLPVPVVCPQCASPALKPFGAGTQRVEQSLEQYFPEVPLLRIDRDSTHGREHVENLHRRVLAGEFRILIGTQMLSKGHDFPNIGLVGVLNVDQSLHHSDFRATERFAQLLVQVSGRAGRGARPGRVQIQTLMPEHPTLGLLLREGYFELARQVLEGRKLAHLPPHVQLALLRAESTQPAQALNFLAHARKLLAAANAPGITFMGPAPAPMEKRQGRHRAQLLLSARTRLPLHRVLVQGLSGLSDLPGARQVRWSLDVDPMELF